MNIKGYRLLNSEKLNRAIKGAAGAEGKLEGGVGEDATPEQILAEYDRLGGLIHNEDGRKVKTGSFFDFDARKPRTKPAVVLILKSLDGEVEISEDEEVPLEVKAADARAAKKAGKVEAKPKAKAKKGKKDLEDEEEAEAETVDEDDE